MAVPQKPDIQLYIFSLHFLFLLVCLLNEFVTVAEFFSLGNTDYFPLLWLPDLAVGQTSGSGVWEHHLGLWSLWIPVKHKNAVTWEMTGLLPGS